MEFQKKEDSWSIQEELELIKNIQEILPKEAEKKSCSTTLSNFDWNIISTQTKSPESCRKHFYKLKSMICAQKSLNQITSEIMFILQDPKLRKAHIPVPYNIFIKDYFKENKNKLKDSNSYFQMLTSEGAKAWKDLPDNVRQLYKNQYKDELKLKDLDTDTGIVQLYTNQYKDELKLKDLDTDTGITKSKSSFSHFLQDVFDQFHMSKEGRRKARESWSQLPFEEKLPYIKMSIEDEARCKDELAEYLFNNQNAKTFFVLGPTWEEKEKYLIYTGMPKAPPKKYALLFLETLNDFEEYKGKEKLIVACQMFKDLPTDLQEKTKNDFHEAWNKYYFEFTEWKNQQTPVIQNLSELYVKQKKIMPYNTKRNRKDITSKVDLSSLDLDNYSPHDNEQPHTSDKLQDKDNFSQVFETSNKSTVQRVKNTSTASKKIAVKYNGSSSFGRKITLSFLSDITPTSSGIKKSNKQKSNAGIKRKNNTNQSVSKKVKGDSVSNKENQCPNNSNKMELQGQEETVTFPEVIGEPKPVAKTPWLYCLSEQRTILGSPGRARQRALKLYKDNENAIKAMHQLKVKEYKENIQNFLNRLPSEYKKTYLESRSNQIDDTKYINSFQELLDYHVDSI